MKGEILPGTREWYKLKFHESESVLAEARRQLEELRKLCAASYQMAGCYHAPVEFLDNLSAAAQEEPLPHDPMDGLPVTNQWQQQLSASQERERVLREALKDARSCLIAANYDPAIAGGVIQRIDRAAQASAEDRQHG